MESKVKVYRKGPMGESVRMVQVSFPDPAPGPGGMALAAYTIEAAPQGLVVADERTGEVLVIDDLVGAESALVDNKRVYEAGRVTLSQG